MSRSFIRLRRALFGVSCTVVFGFGATQAFGSGSRPAPAPRLCPQSQDPAPYYSERCAYGCAEGIGYCDVDFICKCGYIP
jgi:hypothetical protein